MTLTVLEVLRRSTEYLQRSGIDSPRLEAELLLAFALDTDRIGLYLHFDQPLQEPELATLRRLLAARRARTPIAYLRGEQEFRSLSFAVGPGVLIPRPETEMLVELAVARLAELEGESHLCADLGCGSGCVAVAVAAASPRARVTATDLEPAALSLTRSNAARHGVEERVAVKEGSWSEPLPEQRYDLIVSNPPYVTTAEIEELEVEVREHEPRRALDGGPDGLRCYQELLPPLRRVAGSGTVLLLEGDPRRLPAVARLCRELWEGAEITLHRDLSDRERVLEARLG